MGVPWHCYKVNTTPATPCGHPACIERNTEGSTPYTHYDSPAPSETQLTLQIEEILYAFSNYWREGAKDTMPPGEYLTPTQARKTLESLFQQALTSLKREMEKKGDDLRDEIDVSVLTVLQKHNFAHGMVREDIVDAVMVDVYEAISECQRVIDEWPSSRQDKRSDGKSVACVVEPVVYSTSTGVEATEATPVKKDGIVYET